MMQIWMASISFVYHTTTTTTTTAATSFSYAAHRSPSSGPTNRVPTITRRAAATSAILPLLLQSAPPPAFSFDFRLVAPDQTPEEAEAAVRVHARELLGVKPLMEAESWRDLQATLRRSSAALKQDIHTIIQTLPRDRRPEVRRLYSSLFNNVTRMDYAARSRDAAVVQQHYHNVVAVLNDIFARIQ